MKRKEKRITRFMKDLVEAFVDCMILGLVVAELICGLMLIG